MVGRAPALLDFSAFTPYTSRPARPTLAQRIDPRQIPTLPLQPSTRAPPRVASRSGRHRLSARGGLLAPLAVAAAAAAGLAIPGAAGAALLYPLLGYAPGAALMRALPLRRGPLAQSAMALALAPLVATVCAWAAMAAGLGLVAAARLVAVAALVLWAAGRMRPAPGDSADPGRARDWPAWLLATAGAGVIALVLFSNPVLQIRSDGWIHAGIVAEIMTRGIPPEDPRFAGLGLNYVWFYNFFVALQSSLRGHEPFHVMALFNAVNLGATLLVAWVIGDALWGRTGAMGTALLTGLGFNAGSWLLWPLHLVRGLVGVNRGWEDVADAVRNVHLNDWRVIWTISAPFGSMANFWDKFLIGTALNYAYLMLSVYLGAIVLWFGRGAPAALGLAGLGAAGMLLFHGVVGLSAVPVTMGALALAWLLRLRWRDLPGTRQLAAFAGATAAGAVAAAPYTWSISRGWSAEKSGLHHDYFVFDPFLVWTLLVSVTAAAILARRPLLDGLRARRGDVVILACLTLGMAIFAAIVKLPLANHVKFLYETFLPLALIGGACWTPAWRSLRRRAGWGGALLVFGLVFGGGAVLTLRGYLLDPGAAALHAMRLSAQERALYRWLGAETPPDAVVLDAEMRDFVMVLARRQLWLGTRFGPELAAFPADQVRARRAVMADVYGDQRDLEGDRRALTALGRPTYVLVRESDFADARAPWRALDHRDGFERVYDAGGFVVYHVNPPADASPDSDP